MFRLTWLNFDLSNLLDNFLSRIYVFARMAADISVKAIHVLRTIVHSSFIGIGVVLILSRTNVQDDIQVCRNSDGTQMLNVL